VHDPGDGPPPSGFDLVIECVGAPGMIQTAVEAVATRGTVVVAGVCIAPEAFVPVVALLKELELRFAVYYRRDEFFASASLLSSGDLDPGPFFGGRVGFDGVGDAFTRLTSTTSTRKVLVTPGGDLG
jgi:threonine dehydrogenase-like Zn-dependent dehydrogenase